MSKVQTIIGILVVLCAVSVAILFLIADDISRIAAVIWPIICIVLVLFALLERK